MSVGGQTTGGLRNMLVRNCTFDGTESGVRLKAGRTDGGLVEDLLFENLKMTNVRYPIDFSSFYPKNPKDPTTMPAEPVGKTTPVWRNITLRNINSDGGEFAGRIWGLPEMPIENVVLHAVHLTASKPMDIVHARGVRFEKSRVKVGQGKPLNVQRAEVTGIDPATGR